MEQKKPERGCKIFQYAASVIYHLSCSFFKQFNLWEDHRSINIYKALHWTRTNSIKISKLYSPIHIFLSIHSFIRLFLFFNLLIYLFIYLFICLFIYSLNLFMYLFIFKNLFTYLFTAHPQIRAGKGRRTKSFC